MLLTFAVNARADEVTIQVTASGGKYFLDGELAPVLDLEEGNRYIFDISDASMRRHPFYLTLEPDSGTAFTEGVELFPNRQFILDVTESTPDILFYSCTRHDGMGGEGYLQIRPALSSAK